MNGGLMLSRVNQKTQGKICFNTVVLLCRV